MKCQIPQISWHGRDPVLSVDFQIVQGDIRRLATGGTDAHVVIWYVTFCPKNIIGIECACDLARHNKAVNVVRFSPNGEILASGDDEGGIFLWRLRETNLPKGESESESSKEEWAPMKLLRGHLDDICDICWSPNSDYIVSGSIDNCCLIWDIHKGERVRVANDAKGFVQGVTWDPLNQYFASMSSDRMLRIYSAASKKLVARVHNAPWVDCSDKGLKKKWKLFHDDTLQSFCRRLTFSPDGNLLLVPSGIKGKDEKLCHTTYAFSRTEFKRPAFFLPSGQKYTVAVRCCPKLFKLREVKGSKQPNPLVKLPYRILFAVATQDSIFLYDTQQLSPFACVSNIHYTHLTDLSWSSDGLLLIVSSTDGYCSLVIFGEGELGEVYVPEIKEPSVTVESQVNDPETSIASSSVEVSKLSISADKENIACSPSSEDAKKLPKKPRTPKANTTSATKKSSSNKKCLGDILSFFSPPTKKLKKDSEADSDCVIIERDPKQELFKSLSPELNCEHPVPSNIESSTNEKKNDLKNNANSNTMEVSVESSVKEQLGAANTTPEIALQSSVQSNEGDSKDMDDDVVCLTVKTTTATSSHHPQDKEVTVSSEREGKDSLISVSNTSTLTSNAVKPKVDVSNPKPKRRVQLVTLSNKVCSEKFEGD